MTSAPVGNGTFRWRRRPHRLHSVTSQGDRHGQLRPRVRYRRGPRRWLHRQSGRLRQLDRRCNRDRHMSRNQIRHQRRGISRPGYRQSLTRCGEGALSARLLAADRRRSPAGFARSPGVRRCRQQRYRSRNTLAATGRPGIAGWRDRPEDLERGRSGCRTTRWSDRSLRRVPRATAIVHDVLADMEDIRSRLGTSAVQVAVPRHSPSISAIDRACGHLR